MIKRFAGKIWRKMPYFLRRKIIRTTQQKFTASVGAVVTNSQGKILLLDHILRPASGWGIPGGFIDRNEQIFEAIKREVKEETGLDLEDVKLFSVRVLDLHIEFIVAGKARGYGAARSFEIKDLGWFDAQNLPEEISLAQKEILKQVLSKTAK